VRLLRIPEVLHRLGVSRATLHRWEQEGLLPPRRLVGPNTVAWVEDEIEEFIASRPTLSDRLGPADGDSSQ
jgi:prophage regulatory protein